MTIVKTLTIFAASIATAVFGISVVEEHDIVSKVKSKIGIEEAVAAVAESYILQGNSIQDIEAKLNEVGANASQNFPIINAVAAKLTPDQVEVVKASGDFRVQADRTIMTMYNYYDYSSSYTLVDSLNKVGHIINSSDVHNYLGQTGAEDVGVIVLDSGIHLLERGNHHLLRDTYGYAKVYRPYNAITNKKDKSAYTDLNGHGTHIANIITSAVYDYYGEYNGMAPDVKLLSIKAFDKNGKGSYSSVLAALNWIHKYADPEMFRVLNLSIGAPVMTRYWDDPINQAITKLWKSGIVVVTSAGNEGDDLAITVPGNNPYVITVGAMSDSETPMDLSDDRVATFSSRGPTYDGFIKPDIVAPGTGIAVKMVNNKLKAKGLRQNKQNGNYYEMSGTSQAAAVVSGVAALIVSQHPYLSADDVKCRIMSSARPALTDENLPVSPFAQGMGLIDAYAAITSNATGCANVGLDIDADIAGEQHFFGPVRQDKNKNFYIKLADGSVLTEGSHWGARFSTEGSHWGRGFGTQGAHWGTGMTLEGSHWGNGMTLEGSHWGSSMSVEGSHWGTGVSTEGSHWGTGVSTEGSHWGERQLDTLSASQGSSGGGSTALVIDDLKGENIDTSGGDDASFVE
ncbi:MAG: S8 family peptidase [Pseudomonadota bacterium]